MNRQLSQTGLNLIMRFEGCRLTAYDCVANVLAIGYNHVGPDVIDGMTITQEEAERLLLEDCQKFVDRVNDTVYVPVTADLNQNQFDALVSFAYGCGNAELKSLCRGRTIEQISAAIPKYTRMRDATWCDLANHNHYRTAQRRACEQALFNMVCDGTTETKTEFHTTTSIIVSSNCLALQKAINADKVASLTEDGKNDPKTKKAIRKIQLSAKYNSVEGRWVTGSKGECVRFVQMRLGIAEDGLYGAGTRSAVIAWQIEHGLVGDGVCGPVTSMTMI